MAKKPEFAVARGAGSAAGSALRSSAQPDTEIDMVRNAEPVPEFATAQNAEPVATRVGACFLGHRSPNFGPARENSHGDTYGCVIPPPGYEMQRPLKDTNTCILEAIGELDFRRAFLILSYAGRNTLEDIISVDLVRKIQFLPMVSFEKELWRMISSKDISVKSKGISDTDRRQCFDWDTRKTHVYHCHVDTEGNFTFKGPYLQNNQTHMHRVLGDDNVLLVKFAEEKGGVKNLECCGPVYHKIAKEGIPVGFRRYYFFVFKDGGKEEKKKDPTSSAVKCYFVRTCSTWTMDVNKSYILCNKTIEDARSIFMHAHTVSTMAKYMARFSLILSKTIKLDIDLSHVRITEIKDIPCLNEYGNVVYNEDGETRIHTDGTGFISEDLAIRCPNSIYKGQCSIPMNFQRILDGLEGVDNSSSLRQFFSFFTEPPLLIQFRLFNNGCAVKGTLLVNKLLPPKTIHVRPSMIKVKPDINISTPQSVNSLEIVGTSNQPKKTYLSKSLIALLHHGGVPEKYFLDLLENALHEADSSRFNKKAALRAALWYGNMDDYLAARMILCGIPLEEPYLQSRLLVLMREDRKSLRGGKIPLTDCYYLMGTTDPTGKLEANEVCVVLANGQVSGDVLVYKHPGLHFGDIHRLTSTYIDGLERYIGNAKYAIFFPTKGPRSLADEMANSDYDGDMYWISKNPQLLEYFNPSEPWEAPITKQISVHPKPTDFSGMDLERELFQQFLVARFTPSHAMGSASDSWLVFMDRLLTPNICAEEKKRLTEKLLQLVNIYYDALDASKSGAKVNVPNQLRAEFYPHFMERDNSYHSTSILGMIYDKVNEMQHEDPPFSEIQKLPYFSEMPPRSCIEEWEKHFCKYRQEMAQAMSLDGNTKDMTGEIIQKYKRLLYKAEEFEQTERRRQDIFDDALAIYHVTYDHANKVKVGRYSFAWRVAGHALCCLYLENQKQGGCPTIPCSKAVLQELLR